MTVSTLSFTQASDAEDAGEYMWFDDMAKLEDEQETYEHQRMQAAQKLRQDARNLLGQAALQADPRERDRLIGQAKEKMHLANDPLPERRQALERLEQSLSRSCGRSAVLVRPSFPGHREVYHCDAGCGLISGEGRHLNDAGWTLVGEAEAASYRPCARCGGRA